MNYKVNVTGVSHPTEVGVHMGKMGSNGDLIVDLMKQAKSQSTDVGMSITGSYHAGSDWSMKGRTILELVDSMKSGDTYLSVDTDKHPTGEIRGQTRISTSPKH